MSMAAGISMDKLLGQSGPFVFFFLRFYLFHFIVFDIGMVPRQFIDLSFYKYMLHQLVNFYEMTS
jgi:hypothetical protein